MASDGEERALLREVLGGSSSAWQRFFLRYAPTVEKLIRASKSMGSLRRAEDEVRTVMSLVFEKLHKHGRRALSQFEPWAREHSGKAFSDWLAIVVTNVVRDHMRAKLGEGARDGVSNKRLVNTLAGALDDVRGFVQRPPFTNQAAAHQLIELARRHLTLEQLTALSAWLEGHDFVDIASTMNLATPAAADRLVRAAIARLRRHVQSD